MHELTLAHKKFSYLHENVLNEVAITNITQKQPRLIPYACKHKCLITWYDVHVNVLAKVLLDNVEHSIG